jgi:hypothetical protein
MHSAWWMLQHGGHGQSGEGDADATPHRNRYAEAQCYRHTPTDGEPYKHTDGSEGL